MIKKIKNWKNNIYDIWFRHRIENEISEQKNYLSFLEDDKKGVDKDGVLKKNTTIQIQKLEEQKQYNQNIKASIISGIVVAVFISSIVGIGTGILANIIYYEFISSNSEN